MEVEPLENIWVIEREDLWINYSLGLVYKHNETSNQSYKKGWNIYGNQEYKKDYYQLHKVERDQYNKNYKKINKEK